jgi:hypothetical protein
VARTLGHECREQLCIRRTLPLELHRIAVHKRRNVPAQVIALLTQARRPLGK